MGVDYFYGKQADQFTFYRVPKVLFTEKRFGDISADAKMLYGMYLSELGYNRAKENQKAGNIRIISHAVVLQGNLYYDRKEYER